MSRTIRTVTAGGSAAGGSTGLTTAEVNALIHAKSDWEFLGQDEITSTVSTWRVSEGVDNDTFDDYKFCFENVRPSSSGYYSMRVRNSSGSTMNMTGFSFNGNTSYNYSSNSNSAIFYMYGSNSGLTSSSRMRWDVEISDNGNFIQGFTRATFAANAGYWQHVNYGGFIIDSSSSTNDFAEVEVPWPVTSGICRVYGRRIRS